MKLRSWLGAAPVTLTQALTLALTLALTVIVVWLPACGQPTVPSAPDVSVQPIPEPVLDGVGPLVRRQIEAAQASVQPESVSDDDRGAGEWATAYGELARTYHAYSFLEAADIAYTNARRYDPESFRWAYLQSVLRQELGRFDQAAALLDVALEQRPDDLTARVRRASIRRELGYTERARADLEAILAETDDVALVHYLLGQIDSDAGEWQNAVARFERVLELQPGASRVRYPLSRAYARLGRLAEAQAESERSGTVDVTVDDALMAELSQLRQGADSLVRRGAKLQIDGDWRGAAAAYRDAVEADPEHLEARMSLGGALAELADLEGAEEHLRRALEIDPSQALAWYNLAGVLRGQGRLDAALDVYETAIQRNPGDARTRLAKAQTQFDAGRLDDARTSYENLARDPTGSAAIDAEIGLLRLDDAQGDGAAVANRARALLDRDLSDFQRRLVHLFLAGWSARAGEVDAALAHYDQVIENFEREARGADGAIPPATRRQLGDAWLGRANLLGARGRFADATRAYDQAQLFDPQRAEAWLGGATADALSGRWSDARRRLQTGLETLEDGPRQVDLRHTLARLLATAPDAQVRDGELALELARAALGEGGPVEYAETVGMALAELGRWQEAVDWQQRVVGQLESAGETRRAAAARALLEQYLRQEPVRQGT